MLQNVLPHIVCNYRFHQRGLQIPKSYIVQFNTLAKKLADTKCWKCAEVFHVLLKLRIKIKAKTGQSGCEKTKLAIKNYDPALLMLIMLIRPLHSYFIVHYFNHHLSEKLSVKQPSASNNQPFNMSLN